MISKLRNIFYSSFLGGLYFEFLLFLDRKLNKTKIKNVDLTIARAIREYSLTAEGVKSAKRNLAKVVNSKTTEGYRNYFEQSPDIVPHAEYDKSDTKAQIVEAIKQQMDFSNVDIKSNTDRAKMVEKRIQDYKELQNHIEKRQAIRKARRAINNGK